MKKREEYFSGIPEKSNSEAYQLRLGRLKARRKHWLKVHLYLGLFAGAILVIIGLTGSILVFFQEIDAWLNPALMHVEASSEGREAYRPLAEIVSSADAAMPSASQRSFIFYPQNVDQAFWITYQEPSIASRQTDTFNVFVNPYTAKVTGTRVWYHASNPLEHSLMGFIFKLHYSLLFGNNGALLVGILGVLLTVSVLTGLIVWWPLTGKWRQALTIKPRSGAERMNHDLHKTCGFYSAPVLLAVLISGVYFNLPEQFIWLVERFSPISQPKDFTSSPRQNRPTISIDRAFEQIRHRYPDEQIYLFIIPNTVKAAYMFSLMKPIAGVFTGRHQIIIDQYSGEIIGDLSPTAGSRGQMFVQWQWSLHSGRAMGMTGRILVCLSGLVCTMLYATGVIRWLQKRKACALKAIRCGRQSSR